MRINAGIEIQTIELPDELAQKVWDEFDTNIRQVITKYFLGCVEKSIGPEKAFHANGRTQVIVR